MGFVACFFNELLLLAMSFSGCVSGIALRSPAHSDAVFHLRCGWNAGICTLERHTQTCTQRQKKDIIPSDSTTLSQFE